MTEVKSESGNSGLKANLEKGKEEKEREDNWGRPRVFV